MELRGEQHRLFQPFTDKQGVTKPKLSWTNLPLKESDSLPGFCKSFGVSDGEWEARGRPGRAASGRGATGWQTAHSGRASISTASWGRRTQRRARRSGGAESRAELSSVNNGFPSLMLGMCLFMVACVPVCRAVRQLHVSAVAHFPHAQDSLSTRREGCTDCLLPVRHYTAYAMCAADYSRGR